MTEQVPSEELAKHIARKIFECPFGHESHEVRRIQFRDHAERDLGGLCEEALVSVIRRALEER